jgi:hypothetical protein
MKFRRHLRPRAIDNRRKKTAQQVSIVLKPCVPAAAAPGAGAQGVFSQGPFLNRVDRHIKDITGAALGLDEFGFRRVGFNLAA